MTKRGFSEEEEEERLKLPKLAMDVPGIQRYLVGIEYIGTRFSGWQRQEGVRTVQGTLEDAFSSFMGQSVSTTGSSRTDAGVHALRNVFHVDLARTSKRKPGELLAPHPPDVIVRAVNHFLQVFLFWIGLLILFKLDGRGSQLMFRWWMLDLCLRTFTLDSARKNARKLYHRTYTRTLSVAASILQVLLSDPRRKLSGFSVRKRPCLACRGTFEPHSNAGSVSGQNFGGALNPRDGQLAASSNWMLLKRSKLQSRSEVIRGDSSSTVVSIPPERCD
ncbi:uncharacterized protein LOC9657083 isoform X5 [Selaginella moellendorffii]|uniref:uncharacterized protein LOC9657083 isoform X5 n=1 Tax=Selaginella moellendorffii TaxID=88036 RepID=UPI000D1C859B|nr:uncharacterized protein LOC9657083 isoform X5 [Selaginella moellendorffii]|eukprot:XP_024534720.1 uncharacterized protein LOC9657083 isoform X5 [Selaginella moellendorffii]